MTVYDLCKLKIRFFENIRKPLYHIFITINMKDYYHESYVKCCFDDLDDEGWFEITMKTMYVARDELEKLNAVFIAWRAGKRLYYVPSNNLLVSMFCDDGDVEFKRTRVTWVEDGKRYAWIPSWYLRYYLENIMRKYGISDFFQSSI